MRNIDATTITPAFLARLDRCTDPRLKEILSSLTSHLHDFAREVKLTEAEWMQGIRFLTGTGQKCSDTRQECILLSDTLGLSMLLVAQNHARPPSATEATVFGPFHTDGAPVLAQGADLARGAAGEPLFVEATVRSLDGTPVAGAHVDVWQADADGLYDVQRDELDSQRRARGVFRTDARGACAFAAAPGGLPDPDRRPGGADAACHWPAPVAARARALQDRRARARAADHARVPRRRPVP